LCLAGAGFAQQAESAGPAETDAGQNVISTHVSFPFERVQTPTYADLYCSGFMSKQAVPPANYVAGDLETPNTTKTENGDIVYLAGSGYKAGQEYEIVRELHDPNRYELFPGQHAVVQATGQAYSEVGRVRVVDTRSRMAIAQVVFACDPVNPGDFAMPFVEKQPVSFHPPVRFDRFAPANGKVSGRIVMSKDFDYELGTGAKLYMNVGSNQGVKVGDYFRAVRSYRADLKDPVDSLSFKAAYAEDTQKRPPSFDANMFTKTSGPNIRVEDLPRRALAEIVVVGTTPTTATGMIVFAVEDVRAGDTVELDEQQQ